MATVADLARLAEGKLAAASAQAREWAADIAKKWDGAHAENAAWDKKMAAVARLAEMEKAEQAEEARLAELARVAAAGGGLGPGTREERAARAFQEWAARDPRKAGAWEGLWKAGLRPY